MVGESKIGKQWWSAKIWRVLSIHVWIGLQDLETETDDDDARRQTATDAANDSDGDNNGQGKDDASPLFSRHQ